MKTETPDPHDSLERRIELALREEPAAPVPGGFQGRVRRRIRIAKLLKQERRMFRRRVVHAMGVSAVALVIAVWAAVSWDLSAAAFSSAPGALGYVDYLTTATHRAWLVSSHPALILSAAIVLVTLCVAAAFVRLFRRSIPT